MSNDFVMQSQSWAVDIEHLLSVIFKCERFGFGGIINSDYIRKHPMQSLYIGLAYIYAIDSSKHSEIEKFIQDNRFFDDWSIDTLLSFDKQTKVINGCEYSLDEENGLKALEHILKEYKTIVK